MSDLAVTRNFANIGAGPTDLSEAPEFTPRLVGIALLNLYCYSLVEHCLIFLLAIVLSALPFTASNYPGCILKIVFFDLF